jgi:hypothetical protein
VYASPPERTPPLISTVLQNSNVLFSVPFAKWYLGDRKRYAEHEPLFAAMLIISSVVVSLAPTFWVTLTSADVGGDADEDDWGGSLGTVFWSSVYICGLVPNSLMNTLQQLYFLRVNPMSDVDASTHDEWKLFFRALLISQVAQMCAYPFLFWVDLLPGVGFSGSLSELLHGTAASMSCSLNLSSNPMCPSFIPAFAFAFVLANLTGYLACALVNKESATFSMVRERLQGCEATQK